MKIVIYTLILIVSGCNGEFIKDKKEDIESNEISITKQTTDNLCQVANYLLDHNLNGDFYLYDGKIKWGMDVDSFNINNYFIDKLVTEKIEYVACSQGIFVFGFYPNKIEERALLLNSRPNNPMITNGYVKPNYKKLPNSKCLDFDWYYQTYK
jgi:hypothetical protein